MGNERGEPVGSALAGLLVTAAVVTGICADARGWIYYWVVHSWLR